LVNIIDEIRNNSLCNLLYMTNSSADIKATCDKETKLPSPPKTADALSIPAKVKSLEPTRQAVVQAGDGLVKTVRPSMVTSSPVKSREAVEPRFPGIRKTPPLYSAVTAKIEAQVSMS
jgi:hypothetical protein